MQRFLRLFGEIDVVPKEGTDHYFFRFRAKKQAQVRA
jgi:hypothetical protein